MPQGAEQRGYATLSLVLIIALVVIVLPLVLGPLTSAVANAARRVATCLEWSGVGSDGCRPGQTVQNRLQSVQLVSNHGRAETTTAPIEWRVRLDVRADTGAAELPPIGGPPSASVPPLDRPDLLRPERSSKDLLQAVERFSDSFFSSLWESSYGSLVDLLESLRDGAKWAATKAYEAYQDPDRAWNEIEAVVKDAQKDLQAIWNNAREIYDFYRKDPERTRAILLEELTPDLEEALPEDARKAWRAYRDGDHVQGDIEGSGALGSALGKALGYIVTGGIVYKSKAVVWWSFRKLKSGLESAVRKLWNRPGPPTSGRAVEPLGRLAAVSIYAASAAGALGDPFFAQAQRRCAMASRESSCSGSA